MNGALHGRIKPGVEDGSIQTRPPPRLLTNPQVQSLERTRASRHDNKPLRQSIGRDRIGSTLS